MRASGLACLRGLLAPLVLVAAMLVSLGLAPKALAQSPGATTHVEFDMTHRERVGGTELTLTDDDPGQDGAESITSTGNIVGSWGSQDVTVEAMVVPAANGGVKLRAEGEHAFSLTGTDLRTDVWLEADSTMLARATFVDELTLSGVAGSSATIELHFQIRGMADALIDIDPPYSDMSYAMSTQVKLEATTAAPHSGGGTHNTSIVFPGGYLASDFEDQKFVDEVVVFSFDVDPSQPIPIEIIFEIEPRTNLRNIVELGTLNANGLHRPSFWDNAAELLGVVVIDDQSLPVGNATLEGYTGYDFPVSEDPPPPFPPANVILSPLSVSDSDLGEYDPNQVPFEQMLDQSGLSVNFTSGQTGFDVYFSTPNARRTSGSFVNNWQSEASFTLPLQGYVDFDLGDSYPIDGMALWNVSLEDIRVLVSDGPSGPWTEIGQFTGLQSHLNWFSYDADVLDFGAEYTGRYVRIQVDSAHSSAPSLAYATVGEVAFSVIPVPEPGGLMMTAWGVAGVAFLGRMRRRRGASRWDAQDPEGALDRAAIAVRGRMSSARAMRRA